MADEMSNLPKWRNEQWNDDYWDRYGRYKKAHSKYGNRKKVKADRPKIGGRLGETVDARLTKDPEGKGRQLAQSQGWKWRPVRKPWSEGKRWRKVLAHVLRGPKSKKIPHDLTKYKKSWHMLGIGAFIASDVLFTNGFIPPPRIKRDLITLPAATEPSTVLPLLQWHGHGQAYNGNMTSLEQSGMGDFLCRHGLSDLEPELDVAALEEHLGTEFYNDLPIVAVVRDGHVALYHDISHQGLMQAMQGNLTGKAAAANELAMQRVVSPLRERVNGLVDDYRSYLIHLAKEAEKGEEALDDAIAGLLDVELESFHHLGDADKYQVPILAMQLNPYIIGQDAYHLLSE